MFNLGTAVGVFNLGTAVVGVYLESARLPGCEPEGLSLPI